MSKKQTKRQAVLGKLTVHVLKTGLSEVSLRQLAGAAGVSDRMLLYYFTDKADIMAAVLTEIAQQLAQDLNGIIPEGAKLAPVDMMQRAVEITQSDSMRAHMQLWIEVAAMAGRDEQPYGAITDQIFAGFIAWIESHLDMPGKQARAGMAALILSMIDGIAVLDTCADKATTQAAIRALGQLKTE